MATVLLYGCLLASALVNGIPVGFVATGASDDEINGYYAYARDDDTVWLRPGDEIEVLGDWTAEDTVVRALPNGKTLYVDDDERLRLGYPASDQLLWIDDASQLVYTDEEQFTACPVDGEFQLLWSPMDCDGAVNFRLLGIDEEGELVNDSESDDDDYDDYDDDSVDESRDDSDKHLRLMRREINLDQNLHIPFCHGDHCCFGNDCVETTVTITVNPTFVFSAPKETPLEEAMFINSMDFSEESVHTISYFVAPPTVTFEIPETLGVDPQFESIKSLFESVPTPKTYPLETDYIFTYEDLEPSTITYTSYVYTTSDPIEVTFESEERTSFSSKTLFSAESHATSLETPFLSEALSTSGVVEPTTLETVTIVAAPANSHLDEAARAPEENVLAERPMDAAPNNDMPMAAITEEAATTNVDLPLIETPDEGALVAEPVQSIVADIPAPENTPLNILPQVPGAPQELAPQKPLHNESPIQVTEQINNGEQVAEAHLPQTLEEQWFAQGKKWQDDAAQWQDLGARLESPLEQWPEHAQHWQEKAEKWQIEAEEWQAQAAKQEQTALNAPPAEQWQAPTLQEANTEEVLPLSEQAPIVEAAAPEIVEPKAEPEQAPFVEAAAPEIVEPKAEPEPQRVMEPALYTSADPLMATEAPVPTFYSFDHRLMSSSSFATDDEECTSYDPEPALYITLPVETSSAFDAGVTAASETTIEDSTTVPTSATTPSSTLEDAFSIETRDSIAPTKTIDIPDDDETEEPSSSQQVASTELPVLAEPLGNPVVERIHDDFDRSSLEDASDAQPTEQCQQQQNEPVPIGCNPNNDRKNCCIGRFCFGHGCHWPWHHS